MNEKSQSTNANTGLNQSLEFYDRDFNSSHHKNSSANTSAKNTKYQQKKNPLLVPEQGEIDHITSHFSSKHKKVSWE